MREEQQISRLREVLLNNRHTEVFILYNRTVSLAHGYGIDLYDILGTVFLNCNVKTINKRYTCLEIELDPTILLMNMVETNEQRK